MPPISFALVVLAGGFLFSYPKEFPPPEDYRVDEEWEGEPGISVTYFGASTILISDEKTSILIDGFFSRPSWSRLVFRRISPDVDRITEALACCAKDVDVIFVSHSHHDHAMDVGVVAERTGADVVGSASVGAIARAASGAQINFLPTNDRQEHKYGEFLITTFETPHSEPTSYVGNLNPAFSYPARVSDFRADVNYSFLVHHPLLRVLVVPSANFQFGALRDVETDVSMISIGGVSTKEADFFEGYWREAVKERGAKLIIPIHWDDFSEPISSELPALPHFADYVPASHGRLKKFALIDGVSYKYLRPLRKVKLTRRIK